MTTQKSLKLIFVVLITMLVFFPSINLAKAYHTDSDKNEDTHYQITNTAIDILNNDFDFRIFHESFNDAELADIFY